MPSRGSIQQLFLWIRWYIVAALALLIDWYVYGTLRLSTILGHHGLHIGGTPP